MKVVFLDIDGVLNSSNWDTADKSEIIYADEDIDPNCVELLNKFTDLYDLKVVISSDWRHDPYCIQRLDKAGIKNIYDKLTDNPFSYYLKTYHFGRSEEIKDWLNVHPDVESYVIFDDIDIIGFKNHFVKVNSKYGLTAVNIRDAEKIII